MTWAISGWRRRGDQLMEDDAALDAAGIRIATHGEINRGDCCMYCQHLDDDDARTVDGDEHYACLRHGVYMDGVWNCAWMRGERDA